MSTDRENGGENGWDDQVDAWSDADREAGVAVEQKCGISLVPGGIDD